jgi:hypothetical protein
MNQLLRSATEGAAGDPEASQGLGPAGERFARALAAKVTGALQAVLADPVDFQALTPRRHWQATSPAEVVDVIVLGTWFGPTAVIRGLESVSTRHLPGREHVSYLLRVCNAAGDHLVEQQAYYDTDGDRITWMRLLCSGYRPLGTP